MVLSLVSPRRRLVHRGPAMALAASLLAAGPALAARASEGDGATAPSITPAEGEGASVAAPDSAARARVQARFEEAWRVRVFAGGPPVELSAPRAEPEGVRGLAVKARTAVVALEGPAGSEQLLRWERLRRIEVGRPGAVRGALLGATAGAAMLLAAVPLAQSDTDAEHENVARTGALVLVTGAAFGLIVGLGHPLWTAIPF